MKAEFQVTYFLYKARKDKDGLAPVYIRSEQNSKKMIAHNTGIRISPQQWSKSRNEPKNKPAKLIELETKLKDTYRDLVLQGYEPNLALLFDHIDDRRRPTGTSIISWCDDYEKGKYSEGQKKAVRTVKSNIEEHNKGLTFDKLTRPRIKAFFEYLISQGVANNSQYKRLRALVNVARHANLEASCPDLISFRIADLYGRGSTKNALKTRLVWSEVKTIMETEPANKLEEIAKDVFLLACFSGLRISDILSVNRGELHDYHYERLQTKTKMPVMVTVHKYNEEIFRKFIKTGVKYSRQKLSESLKEVLKRAGIDKPVVRVQAVGYGHKETEKAKWEEISFHSGRRFYSRLLNDLGLGGEIARDELGHGYKSITELYAGSPEHMHRVARVRKGMEGLEKTLKELALMKVA